MSEAEPLGDGEELLHRQVHPAFVQQGRAGSQAFKPTPKDEGQLSVARGALSSAEAAFDLYTTKLGLESAGVLSVTVAECEGVGLKAYPDPLVEPIEDPAHAFVDYRSCKTSQIEKLAKRLAASARERGWQFQPSPSGGG